MPEHVHLLVSEPEVENLSVALQVLKQQVARISLKRPKKRVPGQLKLGFTAAPAKHLWQRRFYDFNVWSEAKFNEKLKYIHANPVRRGLVLHPKDWPWSSWSHYARGEKGLIRIDSLKLKPVGGKRDEISLRESQTSPAKKVKTRTLAEPKAKSAAPEPLPYVLIA